MPAGTVVAFRVGRLDPCDEPVVLASVELLVDVVELELVLFSVDVIGSTDVRPVLVELDTLISMVDGTDVPVEVDVVAMEEAAVLLELVVFTDVDMLELVDVSMDSIVVLGSDEDVAVIVVDVVADVVALRTLWLKVLRGIAAPGRTLASTNKAIAANTTM